MRYKYLRRPRKLGGDIVFRGVYEGRFSYPEWTNVSEPLMQFSKGQSVDNIGYNIAGSAYEIAGLADMEAQAYLDDRRKQYKDTGQAQFKMAQKGFDEFLTALKLNIAPLPEVFEDNLNYTRYDPKTVVVRMQCGSFFMTVSENYRTNESTVDIYGIPWLVAHLKTALDTTAKHNKLHWHFITPDGSSHNVEIAIPNNTLTVRDSHYPYLDEGVDGFLAKFHSDKAPILILMGEPGTGKTSFIKNYINKYSLDTVVTYDEKIMNSDGFYVDYLLSKENQLLVIEDADLLLSSREAAGNRTMSKLLNLGDGLVPLLNKKVVFTTNLATINDIDAAIIRPGRCYDVVNFRKLTLAEANKVSEEAGLEKLTEDKDYGLSDIYNRQTFHVRQRRGGFGI